MEKKNKFDKGTIIPNKNNKTSFFTFSNSKKNEDLIINNNEIKNESESELQLELELEDNSKMKNFMKNMKIKRLDKKFMEFNDESLFEVIEKLRNEKEKENIISNIKNQNNIVNKLQNNKKKVLILAN